MRVIEVSMEQRRNERAVETGNPEKTSRQRHRPARFPLATERKRERLMRLWHIQREDCVVSSNIGDGVRRKIRGFCSRFLQKQHIKTSLTSPISEKESVAGQVIAGSPCVLGRGSRVEQSGAAAGRGSTHVGFQEGSGVAQNAISVGITEKRARWRGRDQRQGACLGRVGAHMTDHHSSRSDATTSFLEVADVVFVVVVSANVGNTRQVLLAGPDDSWRGIGQHTRARPVELVVCSQPKALRRGLCPGIYALRRPVPSPARKKKCNTVRILKFYPTWTDDDGRLRDDGGRGVCGVNGQEGVKRDEKKKMYIRPHNIEISPFLFRYKQNDPMMYVGSRRYTASQTAYELLLLDKYEAGRMMKEGGGVMGEEGMHQAGQSRGRERDSGANQKTRRCGRQRKQIVAGGLAGRPELMEMLGSRGKIRGPHLPRSGEVAGYVAPAANCHEIRPNCDKHRATRYRATATYSAYGNKKKINIYVYTPGGAGVVVFREQRASRTVDCGGRKQTASENKPTRRRRKGEIFLCRLLPKSCSKFTTERRKTLHTSNMKTIMKYPCRTKDEVDRSPWLRTTNLRVPTLNRSSANTPSENGVVWILVNIDSNEDGNSPANHLCHFCKVPFSNIYNTHHHENSSMNMKKSTLPCEQCKSQYGRRDSLKRHLASCDSHSSVLAKRCRSALDTLSPSTSDLNIAGHFPQAARVWTAPAIVDTRALSPWATPILDMYNSPQSSRPRPSAANLPNENGFILKESAFHSLMKTYVASGMAKDICTYFKQMKQNITDQLTDEVEKEDATMDVTSSIAGKWCCSCGMIFGKSCHAHHHEKINCSNGATSRILTRYVCGAVFGRGANHKRHTSNVKVTRLCLPCDGMHCHMTSPAFLLIRRTKCAAGHSVCRKGTMCAAEHDMHEDGTTSAAEHDVCEEGSMSATENEPDRLSEVVNIRLALLSCEVKTTHANQDTDNESVATKSAGDVEVSSIDDNVASTTAKLSAAEHDVCEEEPMRHRQRICDLQVMYVSSTDDDNVSTNTKKKYKHVAGDDVYSTDDDEVLTFAKRRPANWGVQAAVYRDLGKHNIAVIIVEGLHMLGTCIDRSGKAGGVWVSVTVRYVCNGRYMVSATYDERLSADVSACTRNKNRIYYTLFIQIGNRKKLSGRGLSVFTTTAVDNDGYSLHFDVLAMGPLLPPSLNVHPMVAFMSSCITTLYGNRNSRVVQGTCIVSFQYYTAMYVDKGSWWWRCSTLSVSTVHGKVGMVIAVSTSSEVTSMPGCADGLQVFIATPVASHYVQRSLGTRLTSTWSVLPSGVVLTICPEVRIHIDGSGRWGVSGMHEVCVCVCVALLRKQERGGPIVHGKLGLVIVGLHFQRGHIVGEDDDDDDLCGGTQLSSYDCVFIASDISLHTYVLTSRYMAHGCNASSTGQLSASKEQLHECCRGGGGLMRSELLARRGGGQGIGIERERERGCEDELKVAGRGTEGAGSTQGSVCVAQAVETRGQEKQRSDRSRRLDAPPPPPARLWPPKWSTPSDGRQLSAILLISGARDPKWRSWVMSWNISSTSAMSQAPQCGIGSGLSAFGHKTWRPELAANMAPGVKTYKSIDTVTNVDDVVHFPQDFLHSLNPSGLPPHELSLKVGTPIMLLRNISPPNMCNGARLLIKDLKENLIVATILTGPAAGQLPNIPRIPIIPTDLPISFKRLQFPVKTSFAITINKSQGQTFSLVGIDLRKECFSHGQLYVGLSRVASPEKQYILLPNNNRTSVNLRVQGQEENERYGRHEHARLMPYRSYVQGVQCFRRGPVLCKSDLKHHSWDLTRAIAGPVVDPHEHGRRGTTTTNLYFGDTNTYFGKINTDNHKGVLLWIYVLIYDGYKQSQLRLPYNYQQPLEILNLWRKRSYASVYVNTEFAIFSEQIFAEVLSASTAKRVAGHKRAIKGLVRITVALAHAGLCDGFRTRRCTEDASNEHTRAANRLAIGFVMTSERADFGGENNYSLGSGSKFILCAKHHVLTPHTRHFNCSSGDVIRLSIVEEEKEMGRNRLWPAVRYRPSIRLERSQETMEKRNQDGRTGMLTQVLPNASPKVNQCAASPSPSKNRCVRDCTYPSAMADYSAFSGQIMNPAGHTLSANFTRAPVYLASSQAVSQFKEYALSKEREHSFIQPGESIASRSLVVSLWELRQPRSRFSPTSGEQLMPCQQAGNHVKLKSWA
ncbi:hypothetical protein PR048_015043 [Dryococelus australis]|uniref:DNA helicase Pif1-like 2B domain-containing protein n=1 Tax=Dryococelus australis TaxID=614101 RepID=A0ABQ9HFW5_9NEOP|nr:hypothetical protein PR048_015043 [Dryococelus australis]